MKRKPVWKGLKTGVPHDCLSDKCLRKWSPPPYQVIVNDDYYCPSCVLHHRNNMNRFKEGHLVWSSHVPNTFYLFQITDPQTNKKLFKFGRTQHLDSLKRYSTAELKGYDMKLLLQLRGRLETMTQIENWWKEQAELMDLFSRFSDESFHGLTECLEMDETSLEDFMAYSNAIEKSDRSKFEEWNRQYCERLQQFIDKRVSSTIGEQSNVE
ncbi:predicted protein [Naegleria gruberi]|uniref:Predicted protein n=1 Tax=Naegleria gruberi TaxID=5762 RepID=D2VPL3_NAEGR|nr:uncharacterized protein NAEGRDRAFT_70902 [Naegleria gruberi]EFC41143.1 predicted protein [Naegleria gruberi]|eukprot:XP_002673887.1 predicted protein [Naegleria gruberi strain NEG-M]